ncbi:MAG: casein kinase 2 regulatory subunit [Caeruleum heppii]|nr:MAG: casein kinase 2 regulatory subunit [Caeruleum heppii]
MSSSSPTPESWISSFCSLLGHEYFAEVSEDFIEDDFNLTGLASQVPMYKEALEMILDVEPEEEEDSSSALGSSSQVSASASLDDEELAGDGDGHGRSGRYPRSSDRRHLRVASDLSVIESSAEMLYGLIHQRFITSRPGIQQMAEKYELQHFGVCPRVFCNGCRVLPVGHNDTPGQDTVKLFCPSCLDIYTPPNSRFQSVDGAFFGTTFGCLFFMTFPELDVGARADGLSISPVAHNGSSGTEKPRSSSLQSSSQITSSTSATGTSSSIGSSGADTTTVPLPPQPPVINGVTPANLAPGIGEGKIYEPRIYGFRVSERAISGPRMRWLRSKPADVNELDEAGWWTELHGRVDDSDEEVEDADADPEQIEGGSATATTQQQHMAGGGDAAGETVGKRKKKALRRRRGGSPMDTNGVGDGV